MSEIEKKWTAKINRVVQNGGQTVMVNAYDLKSQIDELSALRRENAELKEIISITNNEIEQVVGKALGYPAYKDDLVNFPNVIDDSVCVGEHVSETIVSELVGRYKMLQSSLSEATAMLVELAGHLNGHICMECNRIPQYGHTNDCRLGKMVAEIRKEQK